MCPALEVVKMCQLHPYLHEVHVSVDLANFLGNFEFIIVIIFFSDGSMTFSSSRSSRMSTFSSLTAMETTSLTSTTSPTIVTSSSNLDHAGTGSVSPVRFYFSYSFF